jgi:hypothetical protein
MKRKNRIRFEVVSLICALALVVLSGAPLFSEQTDAKLLTVIFGSIGAGVLLSNLVRDLKRKRDDE